MTNYLKLFNSVAEQDAFRDGEDYVEPHVSCIEDGTSVKYNKIEVDIVLDCQENSSCVGQKIISMSSKIGSYEEHTNGEDAYWYTVSSPNVTTSPVQTLKIKIINSPELEEGVYEVTLHNNESDNNSWHCDFENCWLDVNTYTDGYGGGWTLNAHVSTGC